MLDSLVRVSRRVGRVADADTADADTPEVVDGFLIESNRLASASRRRPNIDRLSTVRTSAYAGVLFLLWHSIHTAVRRLMERKDWLRLSVRRLALNPNVSSAFRIGRSANLREMRRANATLYRRLDLRSSATIRQRNARLIPEGSRRLRPFSSKRFHALLNSLFKVLFNFPSRYLFAIGLVVIFSLRRGLPSALGYTPK
jgi:hypothetical protein